MEANHRPAAPVLALAALALAALLAACSSIPSLNEPPLYSSYAAVRKDASGDRTVEAFVLCRAGGVASDDKYEYSVERVDDGSGAAAFILSLRYTGNTDEAIERISAKADGRELGLVAGTPARGFSGRYRMEVVEARLGPGDADAIGGASRLTLQHFGRYKTFPIEVPEPGLEALKAFLKR